MNQEGQSPEVGDVLQSWLAYAFYRAAVADAAVDEYSM